MAWRDVGLWRMLSDWLRDPVRRQQVFWRCLECWLPHVAILVWWIGYWALLTATVCTLLEWLLYEFVLEPLNASGPYWERTARSGRTFKRW